MLLCSSWSEVKLQSELEFWTSASTNSCKKTEKYKFCRKRVEFDIKETVFEEAASETLHEFGQKMFGFRL